MCMKYIETSKILKYINNFCLKCVTLKSNFTGSECLKMLKSNYLYVWEFMTFMRFYTSGLTGAGERRS